MIVEATLLFSAIDQVFVAIQVKRDHDAHRALDGDANRLRAIRRIHIKPTISVLGGPTHPNGGKLIWRVTNTGTAGRDDVFMFVAGGALLVIEGRTGPQLERDLRIVASHDEPLNLYQPPRAEPSSSLVTRDGRKWTMRELVSAVRARGGERFALAGYAEEFDGTVYRGDSCAYRIVDDWVEEIAVEP